MSKELSSIWGADSPGWKLTSGEGLAPAQRKYSFDVDYFAPVPNTKFVFHNKLPKCGSTTMHNIVGLLSRKNNFTYWKVRETELFLAGKEANKLSARNS